MFKVIHPFYDLTDYIAVKGGRVCHKYEVGDEYPRKGQPMPSEARIYELSTDFNAQGRPLIRSTLRIPETEPENTQDPALTAEDIKDREDIPKESEAVKSESASSQGTPARKAPRKSPDRKVKKTGGK